MQAVNELLLAKPVHGKNATEPVYCKFSIIPQQLNNKIRARKAHCTASTTAVSATRAIITTENRSIVTHVIGCLCQGIYDYVKNVEKFRHPTRAVGSELMLSSIHSHPRHRYHRCNPKEAPRLKRNSRR